jgi:hypothetical protein
VASDLPIGVRGVVISMLRFVFNTLYSLLLSIGYKYDLITLNHMCGYRFLQVES